MSALPTVDYYFYWNTATGPKYSNDRVVLCANVKNKLLWYFYATFFLEHVECSSHCVITGNHQQPTRRNGGFHGHWIDCNWVCTSKLGLEVNKIIADVMGWLNSKSFKLSSSDAPTLRSEIGWPVPRECNTRMCDPKCGRDCKPRRRCDSREISVFRGE